MSGRFPTWRRQANKAERRGRVSTRSHRWRLLTAGVIGVAGVYYLEHCIGFWPAVFAGLVVAALWEYSKND